MSFHIQHLNTVEAGAWDAFIAKSDDAWLYHRHAWIEGVSRVYGVENHFFIAWEHERWVGAFPLQVWTIDGKHGPRRRMSSILMGAAGPILEPECQAAERERILTALSEAVIEFAIQVGADTLTAGLPPLAPQYLRTGTEGNPLAQLGWQDRSSSTLVADLSLTEEQLWAQMAHDARRSVKLARAAGYTVERVRWKELLPEYYRIHQENYERTGAKPHLKAYFELIADMDDLGNSALWLGRDAQGCPVAFHNCGRFKEASVYWSGCCETEHLRSNINYLLFWEALIGAKRDGCCWYEIGEVFPDAQTEKQRGLTTFKKKFGGQIVPFYRAEWPLSPPRQKMMSTRHWGRFLAAVQRTMKQFAVSK